MLGTAKNNFIRHGKKLHLPWGVQVKKFAGFQKMCKKLSRIYPDRVPIIPPALGDGEMGNEPFFRRFIQEGLRSNWDFWRKLTL